MQCDRKIGIFRYLIMDQPGPAGYMPGLDGLRALAVMAVIAYHLKLPWTQGGLLGVCIFFVLSGYLITDILLTQWEFRENLDFKEFLLRRTRRLLPGLFVMLSGVAVWTYINDPGRLSSLWDEILAAACWFSNWWLIFHQVSYFAAFESPSPLGHLWSLAVEGQFYLVWPLLLGLGLRYSPCRSRLIAWVTVALIVSAAAMAVIYEPGSDPNRIYYGTDTRAFALLIGAVLALVWPSRRLSAEQPAPKHRVMLDIVGVSALLAVLIMLCLSNQYQSFLYYGGLLFFSIVAAVLVAVLAHPASRLGKLFSIPPLRWLGVWSYGMYLWHYPVIILTNPQVNTTGPDVGLAIRQVLLTILLAAISWYFIEIPIRHGKWGKHFTNTLHDLKWQPHLFCFRSKASLPGIICVFSLFILAVSGCSIFGQAQQQQALPLESSATIEPTSVIEEGPVNGAEGVLEDVPLCDDIEQNHIFTGEGVTAIGDSVMVGVEQELKRVFPEMTVDAAIGRQVYQAPGIIKALEESGSLGHTIILGLGTNGSFTEKQFTDILNLLGNDRRIVIINTRVPKPWETVVNQILAQVVDKYPDIEMLNWYSASGGHDEYFYADGVHLKEVGIKAYVTLVSEAINPKPL